MAATVEICGSNGAGETVTHNLSNINFGNVDAANITTSANPITVGTNSFVKYIRLHVTDIGTSNKIDNIQIWKLSGEYVAGEGIFTNLQTSSYTATSYATPTTTQYAGNATPTADPTFANLGIAGALTGSLTAAGYSDYWKLQLSSSIATPPGNANTKTFSVQYDEQ